MKPLVYKKASRRRRPVRTVKPELVEKLGPAVNADYFGRVPPERLVVKEQTVFFSGDGRFRSL